MGHTTNLLTGIAEQLAAAGVVRWSPTGAYAGPGLPALVMSVVPQSPDAVVVLSGYSVTDDLVHADSTDAVQIRTRTAGADPRPTDDLADAIFDALHGLHDVTLGGVRVNQMWRQSWTPLGADGNRRHERSDNYYVQTWRPAAHRL